MKLHTDEQHVFYIAAEWNSLHVCLISKKHQVRLLCAATHLRDTRGELGQPRCRQMGSMVNTVLLNVASWCANPTLSTIWKIREENRRDPDVDKSAFSSCLMCLQGGFGSANLPLPTIWRIPEENVSNDDVDKWALSSCLVCSSELRCVQIHLLQLFESYQRRTGVIQM